MGAVFVGKGGAMSQPDPQRLGVVAESTPGETRVAATPATTRQLRALGYEVVVEPGAGTASGFSDAAYAEAGARLGDAWPTRRRPQGQRARRSEEIAPAARRRRP